jgi:hypothetical protein
MLRDPDRYHGHGKRHRFFEGWYYKLVDASRSRVLVLIPGIYLGRDPGHHHGFIQVVQGHRGHMDYIRYPVSDFSAARDRFDIQVGRSRFSLAGLSVDVKTPDVNLQGTLRFDEVSRWPDSWLHPGSMGIYNYIPHMQCYSQVCAMDMALTGQIVINGETLDFTGGRGYVEKNWGQTFPYSWIWVQCNHFDTIPASISCSLAHIPFPVSSFRGFLIGLSVKDQFYAFTTMNRSKLKIRQKGADAVIQAESRLYRLELETLTRRDDFILLPGPQDDQMVPFVQENLSATVHVRLTARNDGRTLFDEMGVCCGVEYGGDQMMVVDQPQEEAHP